MPHGKICYVEIRATDVEASARFHVQVFDWKVHTRSEGQSAFDEATGTIRVSWMPGRAARFEPGLIMNEMVDSIAAMLAKIAAAGGAALRPARSLGPARDAYAALTDPVGNLVELYQQGTR